MSTLKKKFLDVDQELSKIQVDSKTQKKRVLLLDLKSRLIQKIIISTLKELVLLNKKRKSLILRIKKKKEEKMKRKVFERILLKFSVILINLFSFLPSLSFLLIFLSLSYLPNLNPFFFLPFLLLFLSPY